MTKVNNYLELDEDYRGETNVVHYLNYSEMSLGLTNLEEGYKL